MLTTADWDSMSVYDIDLFHSANRAAKLQKRAGKLLKNVIILIR